MMQQPTTHIPVSRFPRSTQSGADYGQGQPRSDRDGLRQESVALVARIEHLQITLAGLMNENRELQRKLKQVRAENQRLQATVDRRVLNTDRHAHIRRMLADRGSRNP